MIDKKAKDVLEDYEPRPSQKDKLEIATHILYQDILQLIGEDEKRGAPEQPWVESDWPIINRNELRKELRSKLRAYFGIDNK